MFGYYKIWNRTLRMCPAAHADPAGAETRLHCYLGYKQLTNELEKDPEELLETVGEMSRQPSWHKHVGFDQVCHELTGEQYNPFKERT